MGDDAKPTHVPQTCGGAASQALSRREFLGAATALAGGPWLARAVGEEAALTLPPNHEPSHVFQVVSADVVRRTTIRRATLKDMLTSLLMDVTRRPSVGEAWGAVLKPDDVVGLKFNRSGQSEIGTTPALAGVLIESLLQAGWRADQIVCIEAPPETATQYSTSPPEQGYADQPVSFPSGSDHLAKVLDQVTAIINVPYLKTHNIALMTCALKNLSHGLIQHPARFHRNGCSPFVADIVALPAIRGKLRLSIVDGLRVVYAGGPVPIEETIEDTGALLASVDPVALDALGFEMLNEIRRRRKLPALASAAAEVRYLRAAHLAGLGIAVPHGIEVHRAAV